MTFDLSWVNDRRCVRLLHDCNALVGGSVVMMVLMALLEANDTMLVIVRIVMLVAPPVLNKLIRCDFDGSPNSWNAEIYD
jgi:hypothetical protein